MQNIKIILNDDQLKIIEMSERLLYKDIIKYGELSLDDLFKLIDRLNIELDSIIEEGEDNE